MPADVVAKIRNIGALTFRLDKARDRRKQLAGPTQEELSELKEVIERKRKEVADFARSIRQMEQSENPGVRAAAFTSRQRLQEGQADLSRLEEQL